MRLRELTDRYQIEQMLTRSGNVLRARDLQSGSAVAIKMVKASGAALEQAAPRYEKLAEALAALRHPSLPLILDWGFATEGGPFLVMELLSGQRLDALADAAPSRRLQLLIQALNGLELLASKGIGHWNLAPGNLFVASSGPAEQVKLLGLGTVIFGVGEEGARFRAPELAQGRGGDWRADIYSLAAAASELLGITATGDPPEVQMPFALSLELASDEALRQILERCLARHPAVRPTHREMRDAWMLALGLKAPEPRPAAPPPLAAVPPPAPRPQPTAPQPPAAAAAPPPPPAPPAARPAPAAPEPPEDGEVLSAVDDEVLNALLSVPPPPASPAGPPAGRRKAASGANVVPFQKPREAATAPAPAPRRGRPWLPLALGAAAGVLLLGAVVAYLLLFKKEPEVAPPPPPPVAVRPPQPPATERLEEAKQHVARGEWTAARQILRTLTFEDQGSLPPEGCRTLSALQETLALAALATLPEDLATGLEKGDFALLQNAVSSAVEEGVVADLPADVLADFERARSLVELYGQAQAAGAAGRNQEVLERFAELGKIVPEVTDSEGLRDRAAAALEAEAEALVREAKYDAAIAKLAPIVNTWPDRPGLEELVAKYQTYKENEAAQVDMLAKLPRAERSRKPHEGIEAIDEIEPTPHLAQRFAEARRKLEDQLRQLDRNPPEIVLRDGYYLEFSRGTPAELSFRASDDYQIEKVQLFARVGRGKMSELPLEATRSGNYTVLIQPTYHQNSTVDFYVVATDKSGHLGYFGTPEAPKQLIRRQ